MIAGRFVCFLFVASCLSICAYGQDDRGDIGTKDGQVADAYKPKGIIKSVTVFLRNEDGHWLSSLEGNTDDPIVEAIVVYPVNWSYAATVGANTESKRISCLTKHKDRKQFGYRECNSAFFSTNAGATTFFNVGRAVLSLGILTIADAANDNVTFQVSSVRQF